MEKLATTTTVFKIKQLVDNGSNVTLSLSEDVELETVSQQQMILEAVDRTVTDDEVKQQIKPLLEAILRFTTTDCYQNISKNSHSNNHAQEEI